MIKYIYSNFFLWSSGDAIIQFHETASKNRSISCEPVRAFLRSVILLILEGRAGSSNKGVALVWSSLVKVPARQHAEPPPPSRKKMIFAKLKIGDKIVQELSSRLPATFSQNRFFGSYLRRTCRIFWNSPSKIQGENMHAGELGHNALRVSKRIS